MSHYCQSFRVKRIARCIGSRGRRAAYGYNLQGNVLNLYIERSALAAVFNGNCLLSRSCRTIKARERELVFIACVSDILRRRIIVSSGNNQTGSIKRITDIITYFTGIVLNRNRLQLFTGSPYKSNGSKIHRTIIRTYTYILIITGNFQLSGCSINDSS